MSASETTPSQPAVAPSSEGRRGPASAVPLHGRETPVTFGGSAGLADGSAVLPRHGSAAATAVARVTGVAQRGSPVLPLHPGRVEGAGADTPITSLPVRESAQPQSDFAFEDPNVDPVLYAGGRVPSEWSFVAAEEQPTRFVDNLDAFGAEVQALIPLLLNKSQEEIQRLYETAILAIAGAQPPEPAMDTPPPASRARGTSPRIPTPTHATLPAPRASSYGDRRPAALSGHLTRVPNIPQHGGSSQPPLGWQKADWAKKEADITEFARTGARAHHIASQAVSAEKEFPSDKAEQISRSKYSSNKHRKSSGDKRKSRRRGESPTTSSDSSESSSSDSSSSEDGDKYTRRSKRSNKKSSSKRSSRRGKKQGKHTPPTSPSSSDDSSSSSSSDSSDGSSSSDGGRSRRPRHRRSSNKKSSSKGKTRVGNLPTSIAEALNVKRFRIPRPSRDRRGNFALASITKDMRVLMAPEQCLRGLPTPGNQAVTTTDFLATYVENCVGLQLKESEALQILSHFLHGSIRHNLMAARPKTWEEAVDY